MSDEATGDSSTASAGAESDAGAVPRDADAQTNRNLTHQLLGQAYATQSRDLLERWNLMQHAGLAYGGDRDYYDVLGYDRSPSAADYYAKYLRNDIARTIVNAPAATTWRDQPTIIDETDDAGDDDEDMTGFEEDVSTLFDDYRLQHYLERWDKLLGIGEYGLLYLGLSDTEDLSNEAQPATGDAGVNDDGELPGLAYLATFSQERVIDIEVVDDPRDPRFGLPERYDLQFEAGSTQHSERVHHSRTIHAAEGLLENEVYGRPRLEATYNRLEDLEKVMGGSAEMFWRGADRKIVLNYQGDSQPGDADVVQTETEEMIHGLRNVQTVQNTDMETLDGQEVDPSGLVDKILELIAGETGIPKRILTGSERGELASTQDRATFFGRIQERRAQFAEPMLLRPLLDRLMDLGIIREPEGDDYTVEWPDLFELNEVEQAEIQRTKAEALATATGNQPMQAATTPEVREQIMDWDPEMGNETSLDPEDDPERIVDEPPEDVTDETPEDIEEFDEIIEPPGEGPPENGDGGEDGPSIEDLL